MQIPLSQGFEAKKYFAKRVLDLAKWQTPRRSIVSSFHSISLRFISFHRQQRENEMKRNEIHFISG